VHSKKSFDKRFLIVALAIGFLLPLIFMLNSYFNNQSIDWYQAIVGGFFSFFITITISWTNIKIANLLGKYYPWNKGWARRLRIELIITSFSAALIITLIVSILYRFTKFHAQYTYTQMIFQNALIAIIINIILISILEGFELFQLYRNSILETEMLRRQNIESQYSVLMNQVNPHFLFNSLNVLSFLVSTNPDKAQEFISRFSWIYRYVMDVKDKSLVRLQEEKEFIEAYLFLQKLRYEDKLDFRIDIPAGDQDVFIPPLSLQILVENAI
jgi:sensor histidine kinase YesM